MIYFNKSAEEKLKKLKEGNFYVLSDFDHTLSMGLSSFNVPMLLPGMPKSLERRGSEISDRYIELTKRYYHNNEKDLEFELINWWYEELNLFKEFTVSMSAVKTYLLNNDVITLRGGLGDFLKTLNDKNIPVIVLSAGIKNILDIVLEKYGCNYKNMDVVSNVLKFDGDILDGVQGEIITSFNKYEERLNPKILEKIKGRFPVLLGDQLTDISMLPENKQKEALKIGFLNDRYGEKSAQLQIFKQHFDIICDSNSSFTELTDALHKQYNFEF